MTIRSKIAGRVACSVVLVAFAAPVVARRAQAPTPAAQTLVDAAFKTAAASHRNVFVHFGASWCGWCHKLDAFLAAPEGAIFSKHFVVVALTVQESAAAKKPLENLGGEDLMNQWGGKDDGLPFFVFLDGTGAKIVNSNGMPDGGNIGYPGNPKEIDAFAALLDKAAPHMSTGDRATILDFIAKHP